MPLFKTIKEKYYEGMKYIDHIYVHSGLISEEANIYSYVNEGVEYLFIENDTYFNRDGVYGYADDAARFSFYNIAVVEMMIKMDYYPDICHEHDYHAAILPALCKLRYSAIEKIRSIKHILTIHNLAYQGEYDKQVLFDYLSFDYRDYERGDLRFNDYCNFMKIGIIYADFITTVSKTYAKEIQTPEFGNKLDVILRYRSKDLYGIVNGIDVEQWDPSTDKLLEANYGVKDAVEKKKANKLALQRELGLEEDENKMVLGLISRLTDQKGLDLVNAILPNLIDGNTQVVFLGTGDRKYEDSFRYYENAYKGSVCSCIMYDEARAHKIYAASDALLVPSLFEPCGLTQLIAMRYGAAPVVRETGGLKDTVQQYDKYTKQGNGFVFSNYNAHEMMYALKRALSTYAQFEVWLQISSNAMNSDYSWKNSAHEYIELYTKLINS